MVYMQGILGSLNRSEKLIAEYILRDPERVLYHTIAEMKQQCGVSVGSIVAFCRTVGAGGFADLKIALARELAGGGLGDAPESKDKSVFARTFQLHSRHLLRTQQINSEEAMREAAAAIERAQRLHFFAIGISHAVAYAAYCKFRLIGLPTFIESDSHMQLVMATQMGKGDVAFGISCSGCTKETVRCLEVARERRATTICLTNSIRSPITEFADIALHATPNEIKYFMAPLASRVTQLAVLDSLFTAVAQSRKSQTINHLQRVGEQLLEHRVR